MQVLETFYWHDYETWGADPRQDRPCQFAGLRTDAELNELGPSEPPLVRYCRPANDFLPSPDACLVTGLSPQEAERRGLIEAEFAADIEQQLARPGTCSVGYNSIRFDEEITRFLFYRNFRDPYAHAWRNGNSRWDLIDVVRLAHALRPEGMEWPRHPSGEPSFRLEHLTAANGIPHQGAHDALADVRATLALARRVRDAQPKLFHFALGLRDKERVRELLANGRPVLHVSSKYPVQCGCIAPVMVVAPSSADDRNALIVWDLRDDPAELFGLSPGAIRDRVFTPTQALAPETRRLPLKKLRLNAAPMVAPLATLSASAAQRWDIDPALVERHWQGFQVHRDAVKQVATAVRAAFSRPLAEGPRDPDTALYAGFFSNADQRLMERVRNLSPQALAKAHFSFEDKRLPELLLRYRARNWPETLSKSEREQWDAWRLMRICDDSVKNRLTPRRYQQRLNELKAELKAELNAENADDLSRQQLLAELADWPRHISVPHDADRPSEKEPG